MSTPRVLMGLLAAALCSYAELPDIRSVPTDLTLPPVTHDDPAPGKRSVQVEPEYAETAVHHLLYLPTDWTPGKSFPVIVEYAGNGPYENKYGDVSSGEVEGSVMGYGLSGGKGFIWLALPFVNSAEGKNQAWWWGDVEATVDYAKSAVRRVCEEFGGDPSAVILTGFSRGAIACNYIGLHDAEIAKLWLECPLPPEDPQAHAQLAARIKTPLALGESYRTRYELRPFFEQKVFKWLQPDLGRCGITEAIEWAGLARDSAIEIVPHVSIAMGPQIAAALHLAAATPNCPLVEYNPTVLETANRYLQEPIAMNGSNYILPTRPGLGSDPAASDPPI